MTDQDEEASNVGGALKILLIILVIVVLVIVVLSLIPASVGNVFDITGAL